MSLALIAFLALTPPLQMSPAEKSIVTELGGLRKVADAQRGAETTKIALEIRALPAGKNKVGLANGLANLSTEGDFGHGTLQEVATTLAVALSEQPDTGEASPPYVELATLVRYEHVKVSLSQKSYGAAKAQLDGIEKARHSAEFHLEDLDGKSWSLASLKGKVVIVNFWATWCPPCRKEMPDLEALYQEFKGKGLVIVAISDEKPETVKAYLAQHPVSYTILLDPARKVNTNYKIEGIPNSYVYNRQGKLVGEAEDMRTKGQFLELLGKTGLK